MAKLTAAADAVEFPAVGALVVEVFWAIAEAQPELSELVILAEREADRIRKACDDYDSVTFADSLYKVLSRAGDSCLAGSARQKLISAAAQLPQAGKDLDAPRIVMVIREAAALFLNRSSLRQSAKVVIDKNQLRVGRFFSVTFRRTLRVPEDGKDYPLPPGFKDPYPIFRVQDYADKVPRHWLEEGGFFIPMHQREAMFLEFSGFKWHPAAAKIAVGNINAVTGEEFTNTIRPHKQDYIVIPDQKWLDGINSLNGRVKQFIAMPLGKGYTVEEQVTDEARFGGIQIGVYDAREGQFSDEDPQAVERRMKELAARETARKQREEFQKRVQRGDIRFMPAAPREHRPEDDIEMGIAAGGSIRQQIFEDQYGYQTWDQETLVGLTIRIVDTATFKRITGRDAPPTPVSAEHYTKAGLPWFHYVEHAPALAPSGILARIRGVRQIDRLKGANTTRSDAAIQIKAEQVREIAVPTRDERASELRKSCDASLRAKRYAVGKRQADLLLELLPKDASGLMVRAECNRKLSRFQEAILDASECLEIKPADPISKDALIIRADAQYRLGNVGGAVLDLVKIEEQDPQYVDARMLATKITYKSGEYRPAIRNANEVLRRSPNNATALLYRGDSFFRLGKVKRAASDFERVVNLAPHTKQARYAAEMLQKVREAAKHEASEISPAISALYQEFLAERAEILKHKRIQSEKAGKDIGFEEAMLDWIEKHRADWQARRKQGGQASNPPNEPRQDDLDHE
ncbi:MAG TPA: tetratricopeptide repeat protein [Chthoniobacterales bacterium]|nr:tetratricopeptide repeat protein [Chthoniobacterales bacterium]